MAHGVKFKYERLYLDILLETVYILRVQILLCIYTEYRDRFYIYPNILQV